MSAIVYEPINVINTRLKDHYGFLNGKVNFRLTWPDDEFEIRNQNFTPEGLQLVHPKAQRVHKYIKYLHGFWVLERLLEVPLTNINAGVLKLEQGLSYEPLYHFYDIDPNTGEYKAKQPAWRPVQFLVDACLSNIKAGNTYLKYKHPKAGKNTKELIAAEQAELQEIEAYLAINETETGDALAHRQGIVVPRNYERLQEK
jgi:hypothetical protein